MLHAIRQGRDGLDWRFIDLGGERHHGLAAGIAHHSFAVHRRSVEVFIFLQRRHLDNSGFSLFLAAASRRIQGPDHGGHIVRTGSIRRQDLCDGVRFCKRIHRGIGSAVLIDDVRTQRRSARCILRRVAAIQGDGRLFVILLVCAGRELEGQACGAVNRLIDHIAAVFGHQQMIAPLPAAGKKMAG